MKEAWTRGGFSISQKVKRALEQGMTGDESEDVYARVDKILAPELVAVGETRRKSGQVALIAEGAAYAKRALDSEADLDTQQRRGISEQCSRNSSERSPARNRCGT